MGMRRALHDTALIINEGVLIGINLGWDHTAEHEWGIMGLQNDFGIPYGASRSTLKKKVGLAARTATNAPTVLRFSTSNHFEYLVYDQYVPRDPTPEHYDRYAFSDRSNKPIQAAWSEGSFAIRIKHGDPGIPENAIDELERAIKAKDIAIFIGAAANPFARGGLNLLIASRVPKEARKQMADADTNRLDIEDAVIKTGIRDKLKAANRGYYALSPQWAGAVKETTDGRKLVTKHKVIFYLNPRDQQNNNYGWYTIEDLLDWCKGDGPIPMKRKQRA